MAAEKRFHLFLFDASIEGILFAEDYKGSFVSLQAAQQAADEHAYFEPHVFWRALIVELQADQLVPVLEGEEPLWRGKRISDKLKWSVP